MNERSKSDLLFEEDEGLLMLWRRQWRDKDKISLKTDDKDPPLLIF